MSSKAETHLTGGCLNGNVFAPRATASMTVDGGWAAAVVLGSVALITAGVVVAVVAISARREAR